ncbi:MULTISPECIES: type II toxin-antitoxin system Phd/YefM family antitoxin [unclassified Pseudomonas]|uniref:type II toxin-antitoxin system Phd/YefM family antitoxin n=1 Tax=unclassified Pseudomonas TaxID=196821 RepID=UPI0008EF9E56|nr:MULTISPECIES: type II toxin-antitoxin system prevent-host-death family antitoxin [unclassified Pseudomonas]SFI31440.1 prevent-host-death family protein [Pseudomonas sp. NFPP04]SFJ15641.1 prevent-host-death family protein [Pseudomonas sp. NFPP11]
MKVTYHKPSRSERAASASGLAVFDSAPSFGYIWPKYGDNHMITVPLGEAKNNLSKLVDEAAVGKVITIAKHGRAMAQLVPMGKSKGRRIGAMKGRFIIPEDFDAPLPDDLLDAFEGKPA